MCDPCKEGDYNAQGHPACQAYQRREGMSFCITKKKNQKINKNLGSFEPTIKPCLCGLVFWVLFLLHKGRFELHSPTY